jgi:hypothetical protein
MMKIKNNYHFNEELISRLEKSYKAKFVCETCIKDVTNGWYNTPVALFYSKVKHPQGSNWFAIFQQLDGHFSITNGISAVEPDNTLTGLTDGKEVVYSSYRHHFSKLGNGHIDGGRDYTKTNIPEGMRIVSLQITPDGLILGDS